MAKTKPMVPGRPKENKSGVLQENTYLFTEKETYEILADKIVAIGGESQVYLARRLSDGEEVLAKIYVEISIEAIRNRRAWIRLLKDAGDYTQTHLLPLYASSNIELVDEISGEKLSCPVDIVPYCRDGHLLQCDYSELRNEVIPGILTGIEILHSANLIHRDIKPENIYIYNGVVVLGDFGTVAPISAGGVGETRTCRGTLGYAAPEILNHYVVKQSDYFSLGCTIATLYNGQHVYSNLVNEGKEGEFFWSIRRKGLQLSCPDPEKDLQLLVNVLTFSDYEDRAGYDDVQLWLKDPALFAERWGNRNWFADEIPFDYLFDGKEYHNKTELTKAFLEKWDLARDTFYRNGVQNSKFLRLLVITNHPYEEQVSKILQEQQNDRTNRFDLDLGFAQALHFFNSDGENSCPVYWFGMEFKTLSEIAVAMAEKSEQQQVFIRLIRSRFLSWKLQNTPGYDNEQAIEEIQKIEDISQKYPKLAFYLLMYRLAPDGYFKTVTADDVFAELASTSDGFYSGVKQLLEDEKELARLINGGFESEVFEFKERLSNDFLTNVTHLYILFEGICQDKKVIRNHYINYGPLSYTYWIQQNLDKYSFKTNAAERIADNIKSVVVSDEDSIQVLAKRLTSLKAYCKDLKEDFQNDLLLAYMALDNDKAVTSRDIDAFFKLEFYGTQVPVGYIRHLEYASSKAKGSEPSITQSWSGSEYRMYKNSAVRTGKNVQSVKVKVASHYSNEELYEVLITAIGRDRTELVRAIHYFANMTVEQAEEALAHLPVVVRKNLTLEEATDMQNAILKTGATSIFRQQLM